MQNLRKVDKIGGKEENRRFIITDKSRAKEVRRCDFLPPLFFFDRGYKKKCPGTRAQDCGDLVPW